LNGTVKQYAEQIYAGVLGKIIGVYLGRPVEGWPYEAIKERFGEVSYYVNEDLGEPLIVADDDISGTFAFFRSVEDVASLPPTASEVGLAWLNYVIERRTILWWGGFGRSTEHTAFLRLKAGTDAPESGSKALNGTVLPEQVGAQIFSDAFAMMYPGDPERAADAVRRAASVSHDGIALDAAAFLGALRALAFDTKSLDTLIADCRRFAGNGELQGVIDGVIDICGSAQSWREGRDRIDANYGYARYPGPCHIVPNHAMTLGSLLLGGDNFQRAIMIAASSGFDTDSNGGCVGCLNGIRLGLSAITADVDLRSPVADRLLVVSADGGSCVSNAENEAKFIVRAAARARGEADPTDHARFTFSYPGSTQGFGCCPYLGRDRLNTEVVGPGSHEPGSQGPGRGLLLSCKVDRPGVSAAVSVPVFLDPLDGADNFSTVASPSLYPTQTVWARMRSEAHTSALVHLYAVYIDQSGVAQVACSEDFAIDDHTQLLSWEVPPVGATPLVRLGVSVSPADGACARLLLEEVDWHGAPRNYAIAGNLMTSIWETQPIGLRSWVSSAENFEADSRFTFALSHPAETGMTTIGARDWHDYEVESRLTFGLHAGCGMVLRSVGHRRFYAALFEGGTHVSIVKQDGRHRTVLAAAPFAYDNDIARLVTANCSGAELALVIDGSEVVSARDTASAYPGGAAGLIVEGGTLYAEGFSVRGHDG
jgi:ADP-ribosylglycohydrolase